MVVSDGGGVVLKVLEGVPQPAFLIHVGSARFLVPRTSGRFVTVSLETGSRTQHSFGYVTSNERVSPL